MQTSSRRAGRGFRRRRRASRSPAVGPVDLMPPDIGMPCCGTPAPTSGPAAYASHTRHGRQGNKRGYGLWLRMQKRRSRSRIITSPVLPSRLYWRKRETVRGQPFNRPFLPSFSRRCGDGKLFQPDRAGRNGKNQLENVLAEFEGEVGPGARACERSKVAHQGRGPRADHGQPDGGDRAAKSDPA